MALHNSQLINLNFWTETWKEKVEKWELRNENKEVKSEKSEEWKLRILTLNKF